MKKYFLYTLAIVQIISMNTAFASSNRAYSEKNRRVLDSQTWEEFRREMDELEQKDRQRGVSYIISGTLITAGGLVLSKQTEETPTKFVYGLTSAAGVAAIAYGVAKLSYGNQYSSFYESLKMSSLTPAQRDQLVRSFMESERDRQKYYRRVEMFAHFLAGALNVYAASQEQNRDAKTFFSVLAGINIAMGVSYFF